MKKMLMVIIALAAFVACKGGSDEYVVGNLEINSFNGIESIQINLKDLMKTVD